MTRTILAAVVALTLANLGGTAARACDTCTYKKVVCHETVVTYEPRTEAYTRQVTRYDPCGQPYTVTQVCYREVKVAVKKVVPVVKWVKVCD